MKNKFKTLIKLFLFSFKLLLNINNFELFIIFILNFINAICPFVSITLSGLLVNNLTNNKDITNAFFILLLICFTQGINIICQTLYNYFLVRFQTKLTLKIENNIIRKTISLKYQCFEDSDIYDELRRASTDSLVQPYAMLVTVLNLSKNLTQIVSVIGILMYSNIQMLYLLLIIPILLAIPNLKIINKEHTLLKELSPKYREQNYYRFLLSTNDYIKGKRKKING